MPTSHAINKALLLLRDKRTFVLYCFIGVGCFVTDFLVYTFFVRALDADYQSAHAVGCLSGTIQSFILNSRFNFRVSDRLVVRFLIFFTVALLGYVTSAIVLHGLVEWFQLDRYLAKLATLGVVVFIQYNLNRRVSFRPGPASQPRASTDDAD